MVEVGRKLTYTAIPEFENVWLFKNFFDFQLSLFVTSWLNPRNWDRLPCLKFNIEQDTVPIYRIIIDSNRLHVSASVNTTQSFKTAIGWRAFKNDSSRKKTEHLWHHLIDRKLTFLHVRFEVGLFISFTRKSVSKEKWHISWGMVSPFYLMPEFQNTDPHFFSTT